MDNRLVKETFTVDNQISFDCWVVKIDDEFWFRAHNAAVFLDYHDPDQAIRRNVPIEARKQWRELKPHIPYGIQIPPYWKPHTIFISEGGLNRLICRSRKPEAIRFQRWVFDEVLPTLREKGTYTIQQSERIEKLKKSFDSQLATLKRSFDSQLATRDRLLLIQNKKIANQSELLEVRKERLAITDQLLSIKDEKISRLQETSAVVTIDNVTRHVFQLYRYRDKPNKYIFLRPQSRYLLQAMKVVNLDLCELLMSEVDVPDAMNILNRLKEKLRELDISYTASANTLTVSNINIDDNCGTVNVLEMVRDLIQESLI